MRDQLLEERIRAIPGVATCTAGPEMVMIVAARGVDASDVERKVQGNVDLEGRSLHVLGGVRMATGHRASGSVVPELGRVGIVALGVAGLVGLLVGPSSARLFENVVAQGSPVTAGPLGAAGEVSAVAHRKPPAAPARLTLASAAAPATLAVEPAIRRPVTRSSATSSPATAPAPVLAAGQVENLRAFLLAEPVVTVQAATSASSHAIAPGLTEKVVRDAKETRTKTATVSTSTSTSTAMFSVSSAADTKKKKSPRRAEASTKARADDKNGFGYGDNGDKGGAKAR